MDILEKIRLAEGVELIPVKEINDLPELKNLEFEVDDYILNKPRSRHRSKVISHDMAQLLRQFEKPITIVDAVINYATAVAEDPVQLLEQAHPFVIDLVKQELLVFKWDASKESVFKISELFEGYRIVKCIQKIEDTEVYEAVSETNADEKVIIKTGIEKEGQHKILHNFDNEARILTRLSNKNNPALIKQGGYNGHPYLLIKKIENTPILEYTKRLRSKSAWKELGQLLINIVKAYRQLYSEGVYHIDVNPRNILVDPGDKIYIIDFGLSAFITDTYSPIPGMDYFSPPEIIPMLNGIGKPRWSFYAEQFSIAAMLYYLYTGKHYTDFSLEDAVLRRQVSEEQPKPFAEQGLPANEPLEKILKKALHKDPAQRYVDFDELINKMEILDFSSIVIVAAPASALENLSLYESSDELIGALSTEKIIREYFSKGPACPIFTGGAGIAYYLYRYALHTGNAELIALADVWCNRAKETINESWAFTNKEMGFDEKDIEKKSVFNHVPGLHLVQALISSAVGDAVDFSKSIDQLINISKLTCNNKDVTMGTSGMLLAMAQVVEALPSFFNIDKALLVEHGNNLMDNIWDDLLRQPISEDYTIKFTGIAHGWAGMLYAALRWSKVAEISLPAWIESKLDELYALHENHNGTVVWKNKINARSYYYSPGWCNGSAGFLQLFATAGALLKKEKYLDIAEQLSIDTFNNSNLGADLCCGLGGRAYALLTLFNNTGKEKYQQQATDLLRRSNQVGSFTKTGSLFKGKFGLVLLEQEIEEPTGIIFPCM